MAATQPSQCVFNLINTDKHEKFLSFNNRNVLVIDHNYAINTKMDEQTRSRAILADR